MAHSDDPNAHAGPSQAAPDLDQNLDPNPTPEPGLRSTSTPKPDRAAVAPVAAPEPPAEPAGANAGGLLLTAALALGCGLGGSYVYNRFLAPRTSQAAADAGTSKDARSTAPLPGLNDLTDRVDQLATKVHDLSKRVDQSDKDDAANDVPALRVRLADLTDATNNLTPMLSKVDHLTNRVSELSNTLGTLQGDVQSLQTRNGQSTREAPPARPPHDVGHADGGPASTVSRPSPLPDVRRDAGGSDKADADADDAAVARGAELFRNGHYKDARKIFERLELSQPDDARVWYYAALADGFATRDWTTGAVELVEKGIAREEAGTPDRARIDAEFKDLTTANGKDWLAAYRKRVTVPSTKAR